MVFRKNRNNEEAKAEPRKREPKAHLAMGLLSQNRNNEGPKAASRDHEPKAFVTEKKGARKAESNTSVFAFTTQ